MSRTCTIPVSLAIEAAEALEREAEQLRVSCTFQGREDSWDDQEAKRDCEANERMAKELRSRAGT